MNSRADGTRRFGFVEWFRPGERDRVLAAVAGMRAVDASILRTHLSWATYHTAEGADWYDWLIPTLSQHFDLLPCIHYTPPSLSRTGRSSGPPVRLKDFPDFVDHVLTRYGSHFEHIELWNEPNNLLDWDWRVDPEWHLFCEMIGAAAYWTKHRGWKPVLGGPCPFDPHWFDLMGQRGVLDCVSAVGFHAFPGTWDSEAGGWLGYSAHIATMQAVLEKYNPAAEVWITEAGYSTWRGDELEQVARFRSALAAPASRLYWYGWQDIPHSVAVQEGVYFDPRHYHLGITNIAGRPKMLHRILESGGVQEFNKTVVKPIPRTVRACGPIAIFGGAGFIGANLADSFLRSGDDVIVLDNLSRPGAERNVSWLAGTHGIRFNFVAGDIRDADIVDAVLKDARAVFHLAAQVAVTSSLVDPQEDFATNTMGTLTVLESIRRLAPAIPLVFASTNKVYGNLEDLEMSEEADCYNPVDDRIRSLGIDELRPLAFATPYGCSKGAADQYVLDYARSFGLRTAVLRKSCVYGPRQFGTEDQGWVAHFLIRALRDEPVVVFGDGKQVRDVLHVADAVTAYHSILRNIDKLAGRAFNLGGGIQNAISLRTLLDEIAVLKGSAVRVTFADKRTGDQRYFVADTRNIAQCVGWRAKIGWREGLRDLADWLAVDLDLPSLSTRRFRRSARA